MGVDNSVGSKMGARFLQHPLNSVTNDLMELILQYDMIKNVWF